MAATLILQEEEVVEGFRKTTICENGHCNSGMLSSEIVQFKSSFMTFFFSFQKVNL